MRVPLCRHIKTNGLQCLAVALSGETYCYFHSRLHQRHTCFRPVDGSTPTLTPGQTIQLAPLEDRESVQVALSVVINALATGQLDTRRATALLYGLQLASLNSAHLRPELTGHRLVRSVQPTPESVDLAPPGATLNIDASCGDPVYPRIEIHKNWREQVRVPPTIDRPSPSHPS